MRVDRSSLGLRQLEEVGSGSLDLDGVAEEEGTEQSVIGGRSTKKLLQVDDGINGGAELPAMIWTGGMGSTHSIIVA